MAIERRPLHTTPCIILWVCRCFQIFFNLILHPSVLTYIFNSFFKQNLNSTKSITILYNFVVYASMLQFCRWLCFALMIDVPALQIKVQLMLKYSDNKMFVAHAHHTQWHSESAGAQPKRLTLKYFRFLCALHLRLLVQESCVFAFNFFCVLVLFTFAY